MTLQSTIYVYFYSLFPTNTHFRINNHSKQNGISSQIIHHKKNGWFLIQSFKFRSEMN